MKGRSRILKSVVKSSIKHIGLLSMLVIVNTLITSILPKYTQMLLDGHYELEKIMYFCLLGISSPTLSFIINLASIRLKNYVTVFLNNEMISKILKTEFSFFEKGENGVIYSRVFNDIDSIKGFVCTTTINAFRNILFLLIITPIMLEMSYKITVIVFASTILLVIINFSQGSRIKRLSLNMKSNRDKVISAQFGYIANIENIKLECLRNETKKEFKSLLETVIISANRLEILNSILSCISNLVSVFMLCSILGLGLILNRKAELSFGEITAFLIYYNMIYHPMSNLVGIRNMWKAVVPSIERVEEYLNLPEENTNGDAISTIESIRFLDVVKKHEDVVLKYDYEFQCKNVHALVGKNGSGKSTLLKLMLGLYKPLKGSLMFNSKSIEDLNVDSYRGKISYMSQTMLLPSGKLSDVLNVNPDNMELFLELVKLFKLEKALPLNENTMINETNNFSGGEIQSIKIIKVFLSKREIYILDEPTNNLDGDRKRVLYNLIRESDNFMILVTHDLALVELCDHVHRLDKNL